MRINFKVGYLIIQKNIIQWQHSRELLHKHGVSHAYDEMTITTRDPAMESVMTPSVALYSRATSTDYKQYHTSNPNPQAVKPQYYGIRDNESRSSSVQDPGADIIKFGKRMNFGKQLNNEDVLEEHLAQMRQKNEGQKLARELKLKEEREALVRVK